MPNLGALKNFQKALNNVALISCHSMPLCFHSHCRFYTNWLTYWLGNAGTTINRQIVLIIPKYLRIFQTTQKILAKFSYPKNPGIENFKPPKNNLLTSFSRPECWALESGIKLKDSGIPLVIGIWNPGSTDKESGFNSVESRIQDCLGLLYTGRYDKKRCPVILQPSTTWLSSNRNECQCI